METENIVRELIAHPAYISCILLEDPINRAGVTVLYVDGSSFFKPIEMDLTSGLSPKSSGIDLTSGKFEEGKSESTTRWINGAESEIAPR